MPEECSWPRARSVLFEALAVAGLGGCTEANRHYLGPTSAKDLDSAASSSGDAGAADRASSPADSSADGETPDASSAEGSCGDAGVADWASSPADSSADGETPDASSADAAQTDGSPLADGALYGRPVGIPTAGWWRTGRSTKALE